MSIRSITYGVSDSEPSYRLVLEPEARVARRRTAATSKLRIVYRFQGRDWFFETTQPEAVIGRYRDGVPVDLDLYRDQTVSRPHARIWSELGQLWIEDLDSRYGTKVNDREIKGKGPLRLKGNEKIRVGNTLLMKVSLTPDSPRVGAAESGSVRAVWRRLGSIAGWLGVPVAAAIVVMLWLPFQTRAAIAEADGFRSLPLQGLLQKALVRAQTESSRLYVHPGFWHGIEIDVPGPTRISALLRVPGQSVSPLPVAVRIARKDASGEAIERQRITVWAGNHSYPLLSTTLSPGTYALELEAGSGAPSSEFPAELVVTTWH